MYETESGEQAAALIQRTVLREGCWQNPPVLHADNGAAMKITDVVNEATRAGNNALSQPAEGE